MSSQPLQEAGQAWTGVLDRRNAVKALLRDRGDLLVVTGLGSASYDVYAAGDHDANFYLWGAMGGAALVGLGLALAQPSRPVAVITGDGEQLMGAGGLVTIGAHRPQNLSIVVLDNGRYGETGMQLSHSGLGVNLHRIADAAGFHSAIEVLDVPGVENLRDKIHCPGGALFATVRIAADSPERALPPRDGVFVKNRFRRNLGFEVS